MLHILVVFYFILNYDSLQMYINYMVLAAQGLIKSLDLKKQ